MIRCASFSIEGLIGTFDILVHAISIDVSIEERRGISK